MLLYNPSSIPTSPRYTDDTALQGLDSSLQLTPEVHVYVARCGLDGYKVLLLLYMKYSSLRFRPAARIPYCKK